MAERLDKESPSVGMSRSQLRLAYLVRGVLIVSVVAGVYWIKASQTHEGGSQEALMEAGLDALYTRRDAAGAATRFRKVLKLNPNHYGATFQLAMALERSGNAAEARPWWEKALKMAEGYNDKPTMDAARARLQKTGVPVEPSSQEALMNAGLDALYRTKDPGLAANEFRQVLKLNPNHYGATFQLAMALDHGGKPAEARPFWEKAAKMAEGYNDKPTLDAVRARLARTP